MNATEQLNSYLKRLERRLRLGETLRGAAILASTALIVTLALVLITNAFAFSSGSVTLARVALFFALSLAVVFALALPLRKLNRRHVARVAEGVFPQFQQRLLTFTEREPDAFVDLLAADTLDLAARADASGVVSSGTLLTSLASGTICLGILLWMIAAGPGYLGHGAALLWMGTPHAAAPMYDLTVSPGDTTVRRNADQLVTAQLVGLHSDKVRLYARYQGASKWEQAIMQTQTAASGFQFLFAGLAEPVEYYVEAGPLRSRRFNIRVVDLPVIKELRVTYRFPSWTGLKNVVEEHGSDLRAVEGSAADIEILTDRPLTGGTLEVENNRGTPLSGGPGNLYKGTIQIEKDGTYHIAGIDHGQQARLSDDYFIEAQKPNPPEIRITSPGRDYKSSPIEEVTVAIKANDEFGLKDINLHYSVNGGPEQTVDVLKRKGAKDADGSALIALEDYKLVAGDLVSLYATAEDGHTESRTDMFFIQAEPFEKEYTQAQQSGGGGGGGDQQDDQNGITQRQKEIISATWNQLRDKADVTQKDVDAGKFLSGMQAKLGEQARTLAQRMQSRQLAQANDRFNSFVEDMNAAAAAMDPASNKLKRQQWNDAMPDEQKALQHLLRAEATFRDIQVAFGGNGGGAGGSGQAERDLENLFNLELDTEKNQYETGQTPALAQQRDQKVDEALQRLKEAAQRQQELAEQRNENHQTLQQRWEQEMLRRQAEELRRQLEQLAQDSQQGSQPQGSQQSSQQSGQQSASSAASSQSRMARSQGVVDPRIQQTLDRLGQASDDMRRAASNQQTQADAGRAADRLREASSLLDGMQRQDAGQKLDSLAREAERILKQQQQQADQLRQILGQRNPGEIATREQGQDASGYRERQKLARERQQMAGDLLRLEKQLQEAAHDMAATERAASSKLRDALGDAQQAQLAEKLQGSVNGIRRGYDRNFNSNEPAIGAGMQRLDDQVHQAQQALGGEQPSPEDALNRMEHFRRQMEALARGLGSRDLQVRPAGQQSQTSQGGSQQDRASQSAQSGRQDQGQAQIMGSPNQQDGSGGSGDRSSGPGGGPWGGYWGEDEEAYLQPLAPLPEPSSVPPNQAYRDALRDLNELRQDVREDPELLRDLQDLMRQTQRFDPKHFPGNPQLLEQLRTQVLSGVEKLELQLRRKMDEKPGQVRTGDSLAVPSGYRDSVADYFRRLSDKQ